MHKGHKDFKTVVSDIDTGDLLEIIDSHKQTEIIEVPGRTHLNLY